MISDYEDIAEFILNNYRDKAVEVGVGSLPHVAFALKDRMDVIVTDISEKECKGIKFCKDDIFNPDLTIYASASLVYSIRPPIDLQEAIAKTAKKVGADLLIRPFGNEKADLGKFFKTCQIVNYRRARFYLYKNKI